MIVNKKLILTTIIRVLIGLVFIVGAIFKLFPIEPLEVLLVKLDVSNWFYSSFLARFLIGFELILGSLLLLNISLKRTLQLSIVTLIGFTLFLLYFKFIYGSNENCGCFGSVIKMNPIESIIKNIVLILLTFFLLKKSDFENWSWKKIKPYITIFAIVSSIAWPFILNVVDSYDEEGYYVIKPGMNIEGSGLDSVMFSNNEQVNFFEGKKLLCFYSLRCPVCKYSASKIATIYQKSNYSFPIYIAFLEDPEKDVLLPKFHKITDSKNIPYTFFDIKKFFKLGDRNIPFLMFLENGEIKNMNNYRDMDPDWVIKFLSEE